MSTTEPEAVPLAFLQLWRIRCAGGCSASSRAAIGDGELCERVGKPQNLVSYHLAKLGRPSRLGPPQLGRRS